MSMKRRVIAACIAGIFLATSPASAFNAMPSLGVVKKSFLGVNFIHTRGFALAPMGHVVFCMENPTECKTVPTSADITVHTQSNAWLIRRINQQVNRDLKPRADRGKGGMTDQWRVGANEGDCEDYALEKRRRLIAAGIPANSLRIAVGRTRSGEGHAVLIVRTTRGDFVLDNRHNRVVLWPNADVRLVSIQSETNARLWMQI
jgi:predicted transglutaminase-like cysteine proteinase